MPVEDNVITAEFKRSELFQMNLSVISRSAYATQKWASACSQQEQEQLQNEISYLTELSKKLEELIK